MTPYQCLEPFDWAALLGLIQSEFAGMEGRIDPPSSVHRLTAGSLADPGIEVWAIGHPPLACVVLTPKDHALYLGKLAVARSHRSRGLARALIDLAETRARALGLPALELQTRVELFENHCVFKALGFAETGCTAHPGYARPTSITFRRPVRTDPPCSLS
ncbi:GNAT family N-acetyltransferase [Rhodobacter sp. Har01]|uniref:GNAT family N-acetyltransferase n=1 Tax=Rhodobacter sp. Har01 TaxID=2883999 RepID=UPI001D0617B9|nr:GNAT family N-acetyltransferase [Rhodobacter sp. Har01]MCB6177693.1 GNAT family N-acetyltransferase [Rhodobacter sp. Har01]